MFVVRPSVIFDECKQVISYQFVKTDDLTKVAVRSEFASDNNINGVRVSDGHLARFPHGAI